MALNCHSEVIQSSGSPVKFVMSVTSPPECKAKSPATRLDTSSTCDQFSFVIPCSDDDDDTFDDWDTEDDSTDLALDNDLWQSLSQGALTTQTFHVTLQCNFTPILSPEKVLVSKAVRDANARWSSFYLDSKEESNIKNSQVKRRSFILCDDCLQINATHL